MIPNKLNSDKTTSFSDPKKKHNPNFYQLHLPQQYSTMTSNKLVNDKMDVPKSSITASISASNSTRKSFPDLNNVSFSSSVSGSIQVCSLFIIPFIVIIILQFISYYLNFFRVKTQHRINLLACCIFSVIVCIRESRNFFLK